MLKGHLPGVIYHLVYEEQIVRCKLIPRNLVCLDVQGGGGVEREMVMLACAVALQVCPSPCALRPTPHTLHPTPYTHHPTPHTLHPTPYTLQLNPTASKGE